MAEQIRLLRELQVIDTQIREIEQAKSDLPRLREELRASRGRDRADIEGTKAQTKRNEEEHARLEKEIAWDKEALAAFEERTKNLTSADALAAQSKELETRRRSIREKEESIVRLMEEREVIAKKAAQLESDFAGIEAKYADQEKEIEKVNAETDAKTADLRAQRAEMAKGIDRNLVARYDQIFQRREGRAVVAVKAEVCQGCDMGVPPQIVNFTRSGEQGVQTCPHCSRILFWEPVDAKPSEKPKAKRGGGRKKKAEAAAANDVSEPPAADSGADDGESQAADKHQS